MVEHIWIRLAELREEAKREEWEQKHPRQALLARYTRYFRIRMKLAVLWFLALAFVRRCISFYLASCDMALRLHTRAHLSVTRVIGVRPSRSVCTALGVKELLSECQMRGAQYEHCLEREELLCALCGEAPPQKMSYREQPFELDELV